MMSLVDWPSADAPPSVLLEQDDIIAEIFSTPSVVPKSSITEKVYYG
jgi:hypothetical protein